MQMKKVVIEIDEKYGNVLTATAVGTSAFTTWVTNGAIDLSKTNHVMINADGEWMVWMEEDDGK